MFLCDHKSRRLHPSSLKTAPDEIPAGQGQLRRSVLASSSCSGVGDQAARLPSVGRPGKPHCSAGHEAAVSRFYPLFVQSHASGHIRRHCGTSPLCFPDSSPKTSLGPSPECAAWHLGAGLLAQASPMGDPANPGIQTRRLHHVSEPHFAHRIFG